MRNYLPNETIPDQDARRIIRRWCEDPALWVVVVDKSLINWLIDIGMGVYNGDTRDGWFQVMVAGPFLVCSMAKSEMTRSDLAERFRQLGAELPDENPDDPEMFCLATSSGDEMTTAAGECFVRWLKGSAVNREDNAPRPKRIRRRCNPLRQRQ